MPYQLLDRDGHPITMHDLQDKGPWCQHGVTKENAFVSQYGRQLGVGINPEKSSDPYAPDLVSTLDRKLADLKTQNTPFFQALERFGIDPQKAVVFNVKDAERYRSLYPTIDIFFWIDWLALEFVQGVKVIRVSPMVGVWKVGFQELDKTLRIANVHTYAQRRDDRRGNARESYVVNLADPSFEKVA